MKTKKILFYLLAGILGGCIPVMSLHPLFTTKDVAFDEKLIGTWVDDSNETTWQFTDVNAPKGKASPKADKPKAYKLIFTDEKGQKGSFLAHLVKLENKLFLDVFPAEMPWDEKDPNHTEWPYNTFFLLPFHTFIRVNGIDPHLKLQLTDDDELKKLLDKKPKAVKHTFIEDRLILTASTKELQAFVLKYADDSRLFTEENTLTRKKTSVPQKPAEKEPKVPDNTAPKKD
ncbi:MAG: hypothetical protein JW947_10000 [Sedimentisphaerales bacterium]|nr:hypothetical protein [Sedimentisphaerales bacterium]